MVPSVLDKRRPEAVRRMPIIVPTTGSRQALPGTACDMARGVKFFTARAIADKIGSFPAIFSFPLPGTGGNNALAPRRHGQPFAIAEDVKRRHANRPVQTEKQSDRGA